MRAPLKPLKLSPLTKMFQKDPEAFEAIVCVTEHLQLQATF